MLETLQKYLIAPSILSADFARLGEDVERVLASGADVVHFDVMDNHYVPNLTIGPMVCKALRDYGITAPIDVHLMVSPVDSLINDFAEAGASYITFHPEAKEGELTKLRAKIVSRTQLNYIGKEMGLIELADISSHHKTFGENIHGNLIESLVGALFIDKGYNKTKNYVLKYMLTPYIDMDELQNMVLSY